MAVAAGRFMRRGVTKVYFVAGTTSPLLATSVTSTRIDVDIEAMTGFTFVSQPIDVPDMATTFTSKIAGDDMVDKSNIVLYEDATSATIRTALAKGTVGFVVIFSKGLSGSTPAAGDVCDVWPCTIGSNARQYSAGNEAAKYNVEFIPTSPPAIDRALT